MMIQVIKKLLNKCKKRINPSAFDKAITRWFTDDGDQTLRLNYDLSSDSLVIDLGGYEGQWSSDIYSMYNSKVYIFEPVSSFYIKIKKRFNNNPNITAFNFGLGGADEELFISLSENSSSTFLSASDEKEKIIIKSFSKFIDDMNISRINLMKINIEGGEYDLLESILNKDDLIKRIDNLQIQFHDFIPNAEVRMRSIQKRLEETHFITYQYSPYVWENWKLKSLKK